MRAFNNSISNEKQTVVWGKSPNIIPENIVKQRTAWQIKQAFKILTYKYKEIRQKRFRNFQIKDIQNLDQLYAMVIQCWCQQLVKEGLFKGYVEYEDRELQQPQGQINIQKTLSNQTMLKGHIICNYDELSENIDVNKILKTMLEYLTNLKDIDYTVKKEINKTLLNFSTIDQYNIHKIKWDQVRYDNNTYRYKNLIDLCRWVYNEKQYENNYGKLGQPERVYMLFKSSVYNIIKHQFGDIDLVESYNIPYILDNEPMFEKYMFNSQPATTIQIKGLTLIIMVKLANNIYYNNDFNIDNKKMNELLMCVRAYEDEYKRNQVGMYIQVNLQQEGYSVDPMITQMLDRVTLGNITIDLWDKWELLLNRVSSPYNYFIQRKKNKDSR